jgi:hypothetical protein
MDEDYEEESWKEDWEDEGSCDYGVSEPCCDPQTKEMGLCTTDCAAYLEAVKRDERRRNAKKSDTPDTQS